MGSDGQTLKPYGGKSDGAPMDPERAVMERYGRAAREGEPGLCVPIQYDRRLLDILPEDILQKDYGCGGPSRHVGAGETVLDLGSGSGKACYIMGQIVGPSGGACGPGGYCCP